MAEAEKNGREQAGQARAWAVAGIYACIIVALFALALLGQARAQEAPLDSVESGPVGLAGMLAGLLIFALVALYNHQRRSRSFSDRIAALEAALEERDDRIWALEERLSRIAELTDAQGDFVVREDRYGRVTQASAALCALIGKPASAVVGHPLSLDVRVTRSSVQHADGSITFDQEIGGPEGARWIAWKQVALRDDQGRPVETQRVGRDVTERVRAKEALAEAREKAEAASRAKSRFLAIVSHEVRTPLNGILGMTDLLLDTPLSPEQQTYARAVKASGDALLVLIEEVLDFSKVEAGRLDLESVPFDLRALVTDLVELIAPRAQAKGIEVAADIADDLPDRVVGDAARLRQVLLNLVGNAVKFTDAGGVAVTLESARDGRVRFEVADTGPGIEREVRERIFHEFEQGDGTLARRHGGTGLGLAIASRIVERMGGEIALETDTLSGSRFRFDIELPSVDEPVERPAPPDFAGVGVLVATPSPVVGPLLVRRLAGWGAQVSLASELRVAEALLPEREWAHVLVDRAFGRETVERLAALGGRYARYRHVLLSPAERGELDELRAVGFESYLVKPVRSGSLATRLAAPDWSPSIIPSFEALNEPSRPTGRSALMVLVAEDNEINALLMQALLGKMGHLPTIVADGRSAVTSVATAHAMGAPYDLVLMDLHLPGMDGLEATRHIRALGDQGGAVPIVALTANAFAEDREACRRAGMNGFVVKPLDRARLADAIEQAGLAPAADRVVAA